MSESEHNIVEISNLIKVYKQGDIEVIAIKDLNLTIQREEILVVMGPSGSGKTTLLNQIGSIDKPTGGTIVSCGKDLTKLNDKELTYYRRYDIGYLFQDFNLSPVLSAEENIILPMKIAGKLSKEEQKRRAGELLKRIELNHRSGHKPHELSGGEKQRIALLASIANEPRLLIADEPTGELDSVNSDEVLKLLKTFNSEYGLTNIVVTHNPAVTRIADRVLNLKDGHIQSLYNLNLGHADEKEVPSFEIDSNIVLKHLFPPTSCSACNAMDLQIQNPEVDPEMFARSTHGLMKVGLGFALCKKCSHITWGFKPNS
jgi:putative ABC transport system ATP-binding protein